MKSKKICFLYSCSSGVIVLLSFSEVPLGFGDDQANGSLEAG